jgi:hypothetical protein
MVEDFSGAEKEWLDTAVIKNVFRCGKDQLNACRVW